MRRALVLLASLLLSPPALAVTLQWDEARISVESDWVEVPTFDSDADVIDIREFANPTLGPVSGSTRVEIPGSPSPVLAAESTYDRSALGPRSFSIGGVSEAFGFDPAPRFVIAEGDARISTTFTLDQQAVADLVYSADLSILGAGTAIVTVRVLTGPFANPTPTILFEDSELIAPPDGPDQLSFDRSVRLDLSPGQYTVFLRWGAIGQTTGVAPENRGRAQLQAQLVVGTEPGLTALLATALLGLARARRR